jgi:acyl-CoA reductase-like NAD-dependent aldehyde dehydrogenase
VCAGVRCHRLPDLLKELDQARPVTTRPDARIPCMAKRKDPAAVALGRRGGKAAAGKAQAARWAGTTPEERRAIMRKVIEARWGKAKRRKT